MSNLQQTISPIDNRVYVERELATEVEVKTILDNAVAAQKSWKSLSVDNRAILCNKAVDLFVKNAESIGKEITQQMGRPIRYGAGEVAGFEERARYMIDAAASKLVDVEVEEKTGFKRFIRREPLGVVFTIAPWNYPYLTAVNSIIPALMAGNSVILKHSAQTPLCAERIDQAFKAAGLPEGVFQYLHASHATVADMVKSPQINYVAFTGSVAGGEAIETAASGLFKSVGLELGGKDHAIDKGATALIDKNDFPADTGDSAYLAPQVLVDVNHTMRVMTEESFGPVVGIQAVKSDEEALELMNDSEFGLTASIWTPDEEAAMKIADDLETGTCFMNRCDYLDPALAWVGVKNSGRGCTLSSLGYEQLTRPKSFHLRRA